MVIAALATPDHSTIAEFRHRHERALADLFTGVLGLCRKAGLVKVGLLAVDGMKLRANASQHSNRDYRRIAEELLAEAERVDREEDERFGKDSRGDELPEQLRTREGRQAALRQAKLELDSEREPSSRRRSSRGRMMTRARGLSSMSSGWWPVLRGGGDGCAPRAISWTRIARRIRGR